MIKVNPDLIFKKNDPKDLRLGDLVSDNSPNKNSVTIVGYPDDEGVSLSRGRVGAKEAPQSIRQVFYKMTPSLDRKTLEIIDSGDLEITRNLLDRHQSAKMNAEKILQTGSRLATLGGGHDYGYSDFAAFCEFAKSKKKKPFIINFDAHLDVRPDNMGPSSGTPFFRLLNEFSNLDFFEVGIQDWCNSKNHLDWLKKKKGNILTHKEISESPLSLTKLLYLKILKKFDRKKHILGLSVDVDAFSSGTAPGASQVFPAGLKAEDFLVAWNKIIKDFNPPLAGFYEVNPTFDQDQRTAKWVAILLHRFCHI